MNGERPLDPEYVAARRVLLDALEALGTHRKAAVLVGAQAIYLHVGEGDLAVSPYTTDGDLAIDPRQLDDEPALTGTLEAAGFELTVRPGTWSSKDVQIDFLVPTLLGGPGRRGARLGVHGVDVARKATGLEGAIVRRPKGHAGPSSGQGRTRRATPASVCRYGLSGGQAREACCASPCRRRYAKSSGIPSEPLCRSRRRRCKDGRSREYWARRRC